MSTHKYQGVKDADVGLNFVEAEWLTPNQAINKLNINNNNLQYLNSNPSSLIYPNELILSDTNHIVDVLLLAKFTDKHGNLKLKSVLLSQLISSMSHTSNPSSNTLSASSISQTSRVLILSLPKDSYYWSKVDAHFIPPHALRVGYDTIAKQFSYIGRMRVAMSNSSTNLVATSSLNHFKGYSNSVTGLIGTLTNIYEYIPAIVLQLHDLSYLNDKKLSININNLNAHNSLVQYQPVSQQLDQQQQQHHEYFNHNRNSNESFWSRLRAAIKNNNTNEFNFNYILSNNYEVLCLKKQPPRLKQLCVSKLSSLEETTLQNIINNQDCQTYAQECVFRNNLEVNGVLRSLSSSIRNLVWPSYLEPGQCLVKNGKMRSSNGLYEVSINQKGALVFTKLSQTTTLNEMSIFDEHKICKQVTTYEKSAESLLLAKSGIYLIYDNNQAIRKPYDLYNYFKHVQQVSSTTSITGSESEDLDSESLKHFNSLFNNSSLRNSYILELSNSGYLRVIIKNNFLGAANSRPFITKVLFDLNAYFTPFVIQPGDNEANSLSSSNKFASTNCKIDLALTNARAKKAINGIESNNINMMNSSGSEEEEVHKNSVSISFRVIANVKDVKNLSYRIIHLVLIKLKCIIQNIFNRVSIRLN